MSAHSQITAPSMSKLLPGGRQRSVVPAPDEMPVCCGEPMQPHLAHAQDRYGNEFFVTVWRCVCCGKSVY